MEQTEYSKALSATEQALLGAVVLNKDIYWEVTAKLNVKDFLIGGHRILLFAIRDELEDQSTLDRLALARRVELSGRVKDPVAFIDQVIASAGSEDQIGRYIQFVLEASVDRKVRELGKKIAEQPHLALTFAEEIQEERNRLVPQEVETFDNMLDSVVALMDKQSELETDITGLPSGFTDLDEKTGGFQSDDFVIVAGRPSVGKSTFVQNIAEHTALVGKKPILIISCEMSRQGYAKRMIASQGNISGTKVSRPRRMEDEDWTKLGTAVGKLKGAPICIEDHGNMYRLSAIRHRAMQLIRQYGELGGIVVDYIQLLDSEEGTKSESRQIEVSAFSRGLKKLAKELHVPVIALAQLSRKPEERADKRPVMSDLRESGAIEQDADMILFLYRDEIYNPDTPDKGVAEVIIGKNRNGELGTVRLAFIGAETRFANLANEARFGHLYSFPQQKIQNSSGIRKNGPSF